MKALVATLILVPAAFAQPAFEVATIKASPPQPMNQMRVRMGGDAGRIDYTAVNLKNLLSRAFDVRGYQITGPSWIDSERYDVNAKIPDGVAPEQVPAMLRTLLEERFKLKFHRETKELAVYELVQAKGGPKMEKSQEEGRPRMQMEGGGDGLMKMKASAMTMTGFSDALAGMTGRPVIDKTDLKGAFEFSMDIAMQDLTGSMVRVQRIGPGEGGGDRAPAPDSSPGGSLFTSIQKLGLKLEAKKAPVEMLVIDQAEKVPVEN
jgi:uncharacterized protein (TIGR03435 family)